MRPITVSQTGVGNSNAMAVDTFRNPFNIGMGVVVTGSVTYTIQHTFDDPQNPTTWFNHPSLASQTASADGNYAFPVRAIRVNVSSGSGTATLTIVQAGMPGH